MRKNLILLLLALVCAMPAYAQKKNKKSSAQANQPVAVTFVAANNEEFILHFAGQRINKEPQTRVEVTADKAQLNADYNVRVVIKKPRVGSDMAFSTIRITKLGEEYVVWADTKLDKAELLTRDQYRQRTTRKVAPNAPKPHIQDRSNIREAIVAPGEILPDNVIILEKKQ